MTCHTPLHRALLHATLATLTATLFTACGPPELCNQSGSGSFSEFRSSDWTPYCAELEDRLQQPMDYELILLTEFFSEYPERARRMQSKLVTFADHEKCFVKKSDQLEYRKLNSCLASAEVESRIKQSWTVRAEPWLKDYQSRISKLSEHLDRAGREEEYITTKITQQQRKGQEVEVDRMAEFAVQLDELQREVALIDRARDDYDRLKSASMSYEPLNKHIDSTLNEQIALMFDRHDANRFAIARLRNTQRFQEFALSSVGVPCESGDRARSEERTAKKLLAEKWRRSRLGRSSPSPVRARKRGMSRAARPRRALKATCAASGHIDNQFDDRFQLCSMHYFVISRVKPADARRFEDWTLTSIQEGDVSQGVDCNLLEGSKK